MGSVKTILLVDDDADALELVGQVLENGGYQVRRAETSQEAVRLVTQGGIDLVVTDLMIESLDAGFSLSRWVKEYARPRRVPVIILTAIGRHRGLDFSPRSRQDLSAMFADAYLEKPASAETLLSQVRKLLAADEPGRASP